MFKAESIKVQLRVKTKKINENISDETTDISYPVEAIRNNTELQKELQLALKNGKKVFLYGGLTFAEYEELMDIEMEVFDGNGTLTFGNEVKEEIKQNPNSVSEENEDIHDIIGYTIIEGDGKVTVRDMTITLEDGKRGKPNVKYYLKEMLDQEALSIEKQEENANEFKKEFYGLLKMNIINAENTTRDSDVD